MVDNLRNIDDAETQKALERKALAGDSFSRRVATILAIILGLSAVTGVATACVNGPWEYVIGGGLSGFLVTLALVSWEKRRVKKFLPSILVAGGRCIHCGYRIDNINNDVCPECGARDNQSPK